MDPKELQSHIDKLTAAQAVLGDVQMPSPTVSNPLVKLYQSAYDLDPGSARHQAESLLKGMKKEELASTLRQMGRTPSGSGKAMAQRIVQEITELAATGVQGRNIDAMFRQNMAGGGEVARKEPDDPFLGSHFKSIMSVITGESTENEDEAMMRVGSDRFIRFERDKNKIRVDFGEVGLSDEHTVQKTARPESFAMARKLREAVKAIGNSGFEIKTVAADARRQDKYQRMMEAMGFENIHQSKWNRGDTWRKKSEEHSRMPEGGNVPVMLEPGEVVFPEKEQPFMVPQLEGGPESGDSVPMELPVGTKVEKKSQVQAEMPLMDMRQGMMHGGKVRDPHSILGTKIGDSQETIREAYRKAVRLYHPDRNPGDKESTKRFKKIQAAYDMLSGANGNDSGSYPGAGPRVDPAASSSSTNSTSSTSSTSDADAFSMAPAEVYSAEQDAQYLGMPEKAQATYLPDSPEKAQTINIPDSPEKLIDSPRHMQSVNMPNSALRSQTYADVPLMGASHMANTKRISHTPILGITHESVTKDASQQENTPQNGAESRSASMPNSAFDGGFAPSTGARGNESPGSLEEKLAKLTDAIEKLTKIMERQQKDENQEYVPSSAMKRSDRLFDIGRASKDSSRTDFHRAMTVAAEIAKFTAAAFGP